jgi:hypothetical protein
VHASRGLEEEAAVGRDGVVRAEGMLECGDAGAVGVDAV